MKYQSLTVEINDHIAHIQLNRPQVMNAMNVDFWRELPECVKQIDASAQARVIVVSSVGKHFSAGMDLSVFSDPKLLPFSGEPGRMAENLRRLVQQLQSSLSSLEQCRIPVLSAVQGACIGGALDMICASDSRYCSKDAFFSIKETQLGMTADLGTLQRLPKLMSQGLVRELAYTGRDFSAQEALQAGFVNQVFASQQEMLDGVMDIARQISRNSPLAVTGCKEMLNYSRDHSVADSLQYMATWQSAMFRPEDMMATMTAKAQKAQAEFDPIHAKKELFD